MTLDIKLKWGHKTNPRYKALGELYVNDRITCSD